MVVKGSVFQRVPIRHTLDNTLILYQQTAQTQLNMLGQKLKAIQVNKEQLEPQVRLEQLEPQVRLEQQEPQVRLEQLEQQELLVSKVNKVFKVNKVQLEQLVRQEQLVQLELQV